EVAGHRLLPLAVRRRAAGEGASLHQRLQHPHRSALWIHVWRAVRPAAPGWRRRPVYPRDGRQGQSGSRSDPWTGPAADGMIGWLGGWAHGGHSMREVDDRRIISAADFAAIPADDDYPIDGYYEALIDQNERLGHQFLEDAEQLKKPTAGQRMLIQLGTFDSQVKNGGITQFFWNCPTYIFDVADWIEHLGVPGLQANYDRAL